MSHPLDLSLPGVARALRRGETTAAALLDEALARHHTHRPALHAYKLVDQAGARRAAEAADRALDAFRRGEGSDPGALCGIPVSVKDLYGMEGLPTCAGTARELPERWRRDGWLVRRLRDQGAVFTGKTHTVELAYAGVGINPHWGTPRNPHDPDTHRIPGGSSCGAGVSLVEGSAKLALGTDTGGSIRIPASMTGTAGHKTTKGRWPTDGVVPLSETLDTVGALAASAEDLAWFFGAVDPAWGDPTAFLQHLDGPGAPAEGVRIGIPQGALWDDCQADITAVLLEAVDALEWSVVELDGSLLDRAADLYLTGAIAGAECRAFLEAELPGWLELLHPTVGDRLAGAPGLDSDVYRDARRRQEALAAESARLFRGLDALVLPGHLLTPPPVHELLDDPERYRAVNRETLRPTCPVSLLGLCALTLPAGSDDTGMPVGLQLVAPGGADEALLSLALAAERRLERNLHPV